MKKIYIQPRIKAKQLTTNLINSSGGLKAIRSTASSDSYADTYENGELIMESKGRNSSFYSNYE